MYVHLHRSQLGLARLDRPLHVTGAMIVGFATCCGIVLFVGGGVGFLGEWGKGSGGG